MPINKNGINSLNHLYTGFNYEIYSLISTSKNDITKN